MQDTIGDEFIDWMLAAIKSMLVEMMAAIARKDYEQQRERQAQGIEKTKAAGKYKGRPIDKDLHKRLKELLAAGLGVRAVARHASCSTTTVLKIRDRGQSNPYESGKGGRFGNDESGGDGGRCPSLIASSR